MVNRSESDIVAHASGLARSAFQREMQNLQRRNLWQIMGYPAEISLDDYWRRYTRDGIGSRVIRAYPDACWRGIPIPQDEQGSSPKEGQDDFSAFTGAWEELERDFNIIAMLARADRLCRTGHYSILIMGFAGSGDLSEPMPKGKYDLAYLAPYAEKSARVTSTVTDPESPRFGMPEAYTVTQNSGGGAGGTSATFEVHHSRVIHIAENLDESDVYGEPALRSIWNYLLDLEKVMGGGAETYWLNARGGMSIEAAPEVKFSPEEIERMKTQVEDFENELRRILTMQGASAKPLVFGTSDPSGIADKNLALISGAKGIPQRILLGNEAGQLASSEDANSWESRVDERCKDHCSPVILEPFIWRMIETGNLPQPKGVWFVEWPASSAASPEKQATIAGLKATALATYTNSASDTVVPPEEFRTWLGLKPESEYELAEDDYDEDESGLGFGFGLQRENDREPIINRILRKVRGR